MALTLAEGLRAKYSPLVALFCQIRNPFLAFFLRAFMRLWTWSIGGIPIFIARYKHREALILRPFRVADNEFDIVLILPDG